MEILLENKDYKELVSEMIEKKIKVDLILTDPPYGVSRNHQLGFSNMGRSGMDYGEWDYGFDQREWIRECTPVIKEGGSIIIFNDWKNMTDIVDELEQNGFVIKDLIRWEKTNPMPRNVKSRYVMDIEVAVWAVKGKKRWTFNKPEEVPYVRPVFTSGLVLGKKRIHPTQKSNNVLEELIKIHTNPNDLVFDPFFGSGSTAKACKNLNRRFIGSEIDEKYYKKAVNSL
ncbi:site-specific DNA-methyltransferase [Acholeplasma laidlawii]|uniref:DNA-methyltransferase n=1 Tax=Acholeplasma laidlawii TaxID=2148 RepID=UPI0018C1FBB6|nr:site-specific DNA-methyltransferase [Acholeplasma laidlawii]MBG0762774.1 site-specific DNA-methyltransferase [Acholeplasma laidlawii]